MEGAVFECRGSIDFQRFLEYIFCELALVQTACNGRRTVLAGEIAISYIFDPNAGIAQLVERNLAKVDVAGSSPVSRSNPDFIGIIFWRRCQAVQGEGLQNLYSSVRIRPPPLPIFI